MTSTITPAGYSGTPLSKKLGVKEGFRVVTVHAPPEYPDLLQPLPAGVTLVSSFSTPADMVHFFVFERTQLSSTLKSLRAKLSTAIPIWVSWPKRTSGVPTDVTEDTIREVALPLGYVDIKVCAVNDVWSGLKLVVRKELR